jgi:ABC-2 type transport system permease protein
MNTSLATLEIPAGRYGLRQAVKAELVTMSSLRSTVWTLFVTLVGSIGVTVLACEIQAHRPRGWYQGFDPTNQSLTGTALAVVAIGVLGVMAATGEYSSGTISSTLAASPRRPLLLLSKVVVVAGVALVACEVLTFSCFGVGQAIFAGGAAPTASLTQPGVLRAVALSGAFLALLGLLGLGLGAIIRHTAGAIGAYVVVTFLVPLLLSHMGNNLQSYTPVPLLASSVSAVARQPGMVSAPEGFLLMVLYSAAVLGVGAAMMVWRDA